MAASDTKPQGPNNPLLVLGKISAILDAFTLSRPTLTLTEIREATGMPTSTVQRLVTNLVAQGFLDREEDSFRVGMKMAYWAAPATRGIEMLDLFTPLLKDLRDLTGETTAFFKAEEAYRVCVALAETRHALRREMHVGRILPLHAGSASHVLLAWRPELLEKIRHSPLQPLTEFTITSSQDLEAAARRTRRDGFSITVGERDDGASGLSAPVFDASGVLIGAVTISGPTLRMPRSVCEGWVESLLSTAERMTRLMGGRFPDEAGS
ncbi:IclR family transcriptional regulator [Kocuria soli]|uniref:IclR family transcriptional regulator n=1 Tax=Kocuria soli TaxID=2485125 RepID=A0A3N3ZS39_9MICC|nr:IclR family transcriptional regulator [Kocuria soli]ROZ64276.1 IclR family transcriptional regulator [Kocuria soli]